MTSYSALHLVAEILFLDGLGGPWPPGPSLKRSITPSGALFERSRHTCDGCTPLEQYAGRASCIQPDVIYHI